MIFYNVFDMLCSFHVILASVRVNANMTHFFIFFFKIIFLSYVIVILVIIINVGVWIVLMPLSQLKNYVVLFLYAIIVWIYQHILIIISHIKVLIYFLVNCRLFKDYLFFLNRKLGVLVL